MEFENIIFNKTNKIATITLNRPKFLNALCDQLIKEINQNLKIIQCIVGNISKIKLVKFGDSQKPNLWDYADDIDTIQFLLSLLVNC